MAFNCCWSLLCIVWCVSASASATDWRWTSQRAEPSSCSSGFVERQPPTIRLIAWPHSITISGHYDNADDDDYDVSVVCGVAGRPMYTFLLHAKCDKWFICSKPAPYYAVTMWYLHFVPSWNKCRSQFTCGQIDDSSQAYHECPPPTISNFMRKNVTSDKRPSALTFKQNKLNTQHFGSCRCCCCCRHFHCSDHGSEGTKGQQQLPCSFFIIFLLTQRQRRHR